MIQLPWDQRRCPTSNDAERRVDHKAHLMLRVVASNDWIPH